VKNKSLVTGYPSPVAFYLHEVIHYLDLPSDYRDPDFASAFDELPLWSSYCGQLLLEHVPLRKGMHLLDLGCGSGFPLLELAQRLGPGSRAVGVDSWPEAMTRADFKKQFFGAKHVELIAADASSLPFPDESFDLAVSNLGVNNFEDPQRVMRECFRVMRPAGTVAITSNLVGHFAEFYTVYRKTLRELQLEKYIAALDAQENHRSTLIGLKELLTGSGFQLTRVEEKNFHYTFADGTALFYHPLVRFGFLGGWRNFLEKEDERKVFDALEANLNGISETEGKLTLQVPIAYVEGCK